MFSQPRKAPQPDMTNRVRAGEIVNRIDAVRSSRARTRTEADLYDESELRVRRCAFLAHERRLHVAFKHLVDDRDCALGLLRRALDHGIQGRQCKTSLGRRRYDCL